MNRSRSSALARAGLVLLLSGCVAGADGALEISGEGARDGAPLIEELVVGDTGRVLLCRRQSESAAEALRPEHYLLDAIDTRLAESPELRAWSGLERVQSCAEARSYANARASLAASQVQPESVGAEEDPAPEDELVPKIWNHLDQRRRGSGSVWLYDGNGVMQPICSGVMINARYMLTAAHCFSGRSQSNKPMGMFYQAPEGDYFAISNVNVSIYSNYEGSGDFPRDLALIKRVSGSGGWRVPSTGNHYMALHRQTPKVGKPFYVHGYGGKDLEQLYLPGTAATTAGGGALPITWVDGDSMTFSNQVLSEADSSICHGDSGGPAVRAYKTSSNVVTGLTVGWDKQFWPFPSLCALTGDVQSWTSISPKLGWILERVGQCLEGSDAGITYYQCW